MLKEDVAFFRIKIKNPDVFHKWAPPKAHRLQLWWSEVPKERRMCNLEKQRSHLSKHMCRQVAGGRGGSPRVPEKGCSWPRVFFWLMETVVITREQERKGRNYDHAIPLPAKSFGHSARKVTQMGRSKHLTREGKWKNTAIEEEGNKSTYHNRTESKIKRI